MPHLLYVDFASTGPYGAEAAAAYGDLAADIGAEPDLLWKVWTENPAVHTAGGVYLFTTRAAAERYLAKHTARLAGFGIADVEARIHEVNEPLSAATRGPLGR